MLVIKDLVALITICFAVTGLLLAVSADLPPMYSNNSQDISPSRFQEEEPEKLDYSKPKDGAELDLIPYPRLEGEIPILDQTNYHQALGTCRGCTIQTDGCLLVSLAMALQFMEVKIIIPADHSSAGSARFGMSPEVLNDWFTWRGTYSYNPNGCPGRCLVDWYPLPGHVVASRRMTNRGEYLNPGTKKLIDYALSRNYPVIAGVHWNSHCPGNLKKTEDCHFVLITGRLGNTYQIIDPAGGIKTTLNKGAFGPYIIDHWRYLKRSY